MSSIYLHIPFCSRKCPYCDFYSQPGSHTDISEYTLLLEKNIQILARDSHQTTPLTTIFFGGGTPSLLTAQQLHSILVQLENVFGIADDVEITMEANPGTLTLEKLQDYRASGLNRLSIGVQSLNDTNLKTLGRIHNSSQAINSYNNARRAGFDNISLDLIFALPGQSLEENALEVTSLLELAPEHMALYGLSFEPDTSFTQKAQSGELTPCSDEMYENQYRQIHHLMLAAGYQHYEISNFSRPGKRCRHNQVYWQRESCLALGCGAHGFDQHSWGRRWQIPADRDHFATLIQRDENPAETVETFDCQSAMSEYCYLRLRTLDGLDLVKFRKLFNHDAEQVFARALKRCEKYLVSNNHKLGFNLDGWLIYDHLISEFL